MYYGGRYYNSNIGRFISPDINRRGDVLTYNRYIYTRNNPFRYTDPTLNEKTLSYRLKTEFKALKKDSFLSSAPPRS